MKREDLPLVTPEKFKKFGPCWLDTRKAVRDLSAINE